MTAIDRERESENRRLGMGSNQRTGNYIFVFLKKHSRLVAKCDESIRFGTTSEIASPADRQRG
jgi:hypothetical protein